MLRTHFSFRRWGFSGILFGLLVASLVGGLVVRGHLTSARAATNPAKSLSENRVLAQDSSGFR